MTFLVTLIALLVERFFNCTHLRNWHWYERYQHAIIKRVANQSAYTQLAFVIFPVLVITLIIAYLLSGWLFGTFSFLFELFIVIYCIGPRNLWADAYAQSSPKTTETLLPEPAFLSHLFVEANTRVFSLIFWYAILGPVAALVYRLITLSVEIEETAAFNNAAKTLKALLEWIPIRIFTFCFALGGHFVRVLAVWRKEVFRSLASNESMLVDCGLAALGNEADIAAEKSAINLIDRTFVIVLVFVALGSLIL